MPSRNKSIRIMVYNLEGIWQHGHARDGLPDQVQRAPLDIDRLDKQIILGGNASLCWNVRTHPLRLGGDCPSPGNVSETKVAFALPVHQGYVKSIATAGRHLVTGGTDEVVKVFDLRKRREQGTLTHHSGSITALAFHSTTHLLTASSDSSLQLLRTRDWEPLLRLGRHKNDSIEAIAMHPSGKLAVSVGRRGEMKVWDLQTGKQAATSKAPMVNALVAEWDAPRGEHLLLASDAQLLVFQASNLEVPMSKNVSKLHCAVFANVQDRLFVMFGGEGSQISYFAVDNHEDIKCFELGIVRG